MNFSIASLLANFSNDKLVTTKALEKKLNCSDEDQANDLGIALDALERIGVLEKDRGKYRRIHEDGVIEGKLRCSSKGFCFAIQDEEEADDIYVREAHLNHAWNGDRVLVRVTKEGNRRRSPEGEVQLILERANSSVLARIKESEADNSLQAVPLDDRLLFQLALQNQQEDELSQADLQAAIDHLVHVEILRYPIGQHLPQGRVAQILGSDAEAAADIDIVYCKHDLPRAFPEEVMMAAKALPNRVRKADIKKRIDLRDQTTISIDAEGAQVIDDALTLEQLDDGNWLLGIHVADVSYYVPSNSPIDQEAYRRGTSVYLADSPVPLLPPPLSTSLCALLEDKERLTISVMVILSADGEVLAYEVQPSVICNDTQLNYHQAQAMLARDDDEALDSLEFNREELDEFEDSFELVDQLFEVSELLQKQRNQRGSFDLNLPDHVFPEEAGEELSHFLSPKFQHDDEGGLGVMVVSDLLPARRIVTECMLLANQLVAKHLKELGVPTIYRLHGTPDPSDVQELIKLANNMGLNLQLENEEVVLPKDYLSFVRQFSESKAEKVLTYLLLSTLKPASYGSHPDGHFGLALEDGYTHFASPVRRYPDLLVHRVLHAVFDEGRDRKTTRSKDRVDLRSSSSHGEVSWSVLPPDIHNEFEESFNHITTHLTERERLAQEAESDLEGLKKAAFMQAHTGEVFHGLITGVQSYGFFVELEELLVEGLVHVSSLKDDWYEYRSRQQKLMGRKNRQQYRLGDRVEVQVKSVDYYRQQIDLVAVGGGSEALDDDDDEGVNEPILNRNDRDNRDDGDETTSLMTMGKSSLAMPQDVYKTSGAVSRPLVLGITGASGLIYAVRALKHLLTAGYQVDLVASKAVYMVFQAEQQIRLPGDLDQQTLFWREQAGVPQGGILRCHTWSNVGATIASGSFKTLGMVIMPCSMSTVGKLAAGLSSDLLERAADVQLKEGKPLILVPRETPLSLIHLRNLTTLAEAGARIVPAIPAWYHQPQTIDDLVDFVVARALDQVDIDCVPLNRWQGHGGEGES